MNNGMNGTVQMYRPYGVFGNCCWCIVRVRVRVHKKKKGRRGRFIYTYLTYDVSAKTKDTEISRHDIICLIHIAYVRTSVL